MKAPVFSSQDNVLRSDILTTRLYCTADGDIDADGANGQSGQPAYTPDNRGLDVLINAKNGNEWVGVVTDRNGHPIIQPPGSYAPGAYVSQTSYHYPGKALTDPDCYIDAQGVPFVVISSLLLSALSGVFLGCLARLTYKGVSIWAVVGDVGPRYKIGEISIAAAKLLGIPSSARTGGVDEMAIGYEFWPNVPAVVNDKTFTLMHSSGLFVPDDRIINGVFVPPTDESLAQAA